MSEFSEKFESFTIGQLRELHEQFAKCQDIIAKQEETIKLLKLKYPNKKDENEKTIDAQSLIEEC